MTPALAPWQLRAAFAARMAETYGHEVPAYRTLVEVANAVNADVLVRDGAGAERLGSIARVTAERHGAIRVGTARELAQVARIFAALGMYPVGFYDLRDTARSAVPVLSTAFRPVAAAELARNPFRMFTSMLVTDDRRFFSAELQARLDAFLARRILFPPELIVLSDKAIADAGLGADDTETFLKLATGAFELSAEPVDRSWYRELEAVSAVAADIGGTSSTHINHLTPRVLDIDELYRRMSQRGIRMIDTIQGPPRWGGPDVLLRQTSFRALAEQRMFRAPDGSMSAGSLRVRFGEVEARGIALTPAGRDRYDAMLAEVDRRLAGAEGASRQDVAAAVWDERMPADESGLLGEQLAFFSYAAGDPARAESGATLIALVEAGALSVTPIVYEDFLPRSAAGIFQSNLTAEGTRDSSVEGSRRDAGWLSDVIGAAVADPVELYAAQQQASLRAALASLPGHPGDPGAG
ncbi:MAG: 2-oxoadipate dioxygenase/decarboxylase [Jatrophihabitantaceae bacterium]